LIFAISTSITGYFTLYRASIKIVEEMGYEMEEGDNLLPDLSFLAMTTFMAPLMLLQILRGPTEEFIDEFIERVEEDTQDEE